ncbi:LamG-like jellyroll fold domain-containing protein [Candidatus Amarolinea dominans]|uniref:LamG-like jellyroll fold domain-containing protein n=1 Tax=Candidatus Amarolinea dominans TaxID=3140696 RepID=UPI003135D78F|nr:hypothetical protein [Anaerolineae bacterium]
MNDYATAPDSASLDLGGSVADFTLEGFFYLPDTSLTGARVLVIKNDNYGLYLSLRSTELDVVAFQVDADPVNYVQVLALLNIGAGWHHIAGVFDNEYTAASDRFMIFLDGTRIADQTGYDLVSGAYNSTSPVLVGGGVAGGYFTRWLEEMRLSSVVRYSNATYTVPGARFASDASTRALWHFDEAAGTMVFNDWSGYTNTLTGMNGAQTGNP